MFRIVLIYAALIVYGSIYPFNEWTEPHYELFRFIHAQWPAHFDKADVIQNVLVYAPLGVTMVLWLSRFLRFRQALLLTTLTGTALSFGVECVQQFLPSRVPSMVDVVMNFAGTLHGGLLASLFTRETFSSQKLMQMRDAWFRIGPLPNIGLMVVALWGLSQTSPLVPSLDVAHLRHGLALLAQSLMNPEDMDLWKVFIYMCYVTALGLLTFTLGQPRKAVLRPFLLFLLFVLACKVVVMGRQLSLEALIGAIGATCILVILRGLPSPANAIAGILFTGAGFCLFELAPATGAVTDSFNWIPFAGQMTSLSGFENILELLWPSMAIAYFTRYTVPLYRRDETVFAGSMIVLVVWFFLEWAQQDMPGRYGDITQVLLGFAGWIVPWCIGNEDYATRT